MNFDFSDDQKFLKEQARKALGDLCPLSAVRAVLEGDGGFDRSLWSKMAALGWLGVAIPEEYGGQGMGYLELCVLAEEIGRALAPVPFGPSIFLAAEALLLAGTEGQKGAWLPKLAAGEAVGTLALSERAGAVRADSVAARYSDGAISGQKVAVPFGAEADLAIVLVRADGGDGLGFALVALDGAGIARTPTRSVDPTQPLATLSFDKTSAEWLGSAGEGGALLDRLRARAAVLTAFEQIGGADHALEMARDYAKGRFAFGRAIGSFQAIKHKLADMYVLNELARSNAYYGAWALSSDAADLPLAAATARVSACQAFDYAAKELIQTHGGMGFTWEADCHLFLRRAKHLGLVLGSERSWKERLVRALENRNEVA